MEKMMGQNTENPANQQDYTGQGNQMNWENQANPANRTQETSWGNQAEELNMKKQPEQSGKRDYTPQDGGEKRRTRRIGSITCGLMLVLYGILFLVHIILPKLDYSLIFKLWPLILVLLGVEILASCTRGSQEKNKLVYDFPAVLLIFIVAFFAMVMSCVNYYYDYYDVYSTSGGAAQTEAVSGSKDFAAKDVESIRLDNEFWDVKVLPSEDNDIHVSYSGRVWGNANDSTHSGTVQGNANDAAHDETVRGDADNAIQFSQVQNELVIDVKGLQRIVYTPISFGRSYQNVGGEVALYLPKTDIMAIKLSNESGDMQIQGISCGELTLNNSYGDVKLESVACAGSFSYENNSGNMDFKNVSCEGFTLDNGYGNIKFDKFACSKFNFDNASGNVELGNSSCGEFAMNNGYGDLKLADASFEGVSIKSDSGSISMRNLTAKDSDITTDTGNIEMSGVSAKSVDVDSRYGDVHLKNADGMTETAISSESGNVYIRYKDKPQDISFDVKSEYGNIRVGMENVDYDYNLDTAKRGMIGNGTYHTSVVTESGGITIE